MVYIKKHENGRVSRDRRESSKHMDFVFPKEEALDLFRVVPRG